MVAALELKYGKQVLPGGPAAGRCTRISHAIAEVVNLTPSTHQPYVGVSASRTKAGLHASAIKVDPDLYQHIDPEQVGNTCGCWSPTWPGAPPSSSRARSSASTSAATVKLVGRVVERVKERELKATRTRRPTPPLSCCCARRPRAGR
ncbi:hypothetical protein GCM10023238_16190 [Streptomyces heliomycini]